MWSFKRTLAMLTVPFGLVYVLAAVASSPFYPAARPGFFGAPIVWCVVVVCTIRCEKKPLVENRSRKARKKANQKFRRRIKSASYSRAKRLVWGTALLVLLAWLVNVAYLLRGDAPLTEPTMGPTSAAATQEKSLLPNRTSSTPHPGPSIVPSPVSNVPNPTTNSSSSPDCNTSTMSTSLTKVNEIQQQSQVLSSIVSYLSKISCALRHWYPQRNQSNLMSSPQQNQSSSIMFPITMYMPSPTSDIPTPMTGMISPPSIVSPTTITGMISPPSYATPTPVTSPDMVDDVGLSSSWWIEMSIVVAKFVWPDISHGPTLTPVLQRSDVLFVVSLVFQFVTWWFTSAKHKSSLAALQQEIDDLKRRLSIDHHAPIAESSDEDESEDDTTAFDEAPNVEPVTDHYAPNVESSIEAGSKDDAPAPDALLEQNNAPQEAEAELVGYQQHQGDNTVSDEPAQDVNTGGDNHISGAEVETKLAVHSDDEDEESKNKMSSHPVTSEDVSNLVDSPKEDPPIDVGLKTAPTPETAAEENVQLQAAMMASTQTIQEAAPDSDGWQLVTYKKPINKKRGQSSNNRRGQSNQRGSSNKRGSFHNNWRELPNGNWRESTSDNRSLEHNSGTRPSQVPSRKTQPDPCKPDVRAQTRIPTRQKIDLLSS